MYFPVCGYNIDWANTTLAGAMGGSSETTAETRSWLMSIYPGPIHPLMLNQVIIALGSCCEGNNIATCDWWK